MGFNGGLWDEKSGWGVNERFQISYPTEIWEGRADGSKVLRSGEEFWIVGNAKLNEALDKK